MSSIPSYIERFQLCRRTLGLLYAHGHLGTNFAAALRADDLAPPDHSGPASGSHGDDNAADGAMNAVPPGEVEANSPSPSPASEPPMDLPDCAGTAHGVVERSKKGGGVGGGANACGNEILIYRRFGGRFVGPGS